MGIPPEWKECFRKVGVGRLTEALSCRDDIIAVGLHCGDIIILDATTGSKAGYLCEHTDQVSCLAFSSNGKLLVSGSNDKTVRLWDVQTGGIIKKFCGHEDSVCSASVSANCTHIASQTKDTLYLWNVQTGECCFKKSGFYQLCITFSSVNPRQLIYASNNAIYQWDIHSFEIQPTYSHFDYILCIEYPLLAGYKRSCVVVQSLESGTIVAEFQTSQMYFGQCCFSPDGKLFAAHTGHWTVEIWNIVDSNPHIVRTFEHFSKILAFCSPSSLITLHACAVNFWEIGGLPAEPTPSNPKLATLATTSIISVSLQARDGIAITSDSTGLVQVWDILTGFHKTSFQTPATIYDMGDTKLINGSLIFAWINDNRGYVWESGNDETFEVIGCEHWMDLIVSGDGSKIFGRNYTNKSLQVWSTQTRQLVGEVELMGGELHDPLCTDGSKVWVQSKNFSTRGWDFGVSGSPPILLASPFSERPHLDYFHISTDSCIRNIVTGKEVFRLEERYPDYHAKWDGRYLALNFYGGGALILDFGHLYSQ